MSLEVDYRAAGVLDKKILLFGTSRDRDQNYVVQSYDMDSKSWDKNYVVQSRRFNFRTFNVGFKDQLYMLGDSISYDPSRGSFETFDMFPGDVCHACSFRQKIYALIKPFGLMRYDEEDQWKQIVVGWSENLEAALMRNWWF